MPCGVLCAMQGSDAGFTDAENYSDYGSSSGSSEEQDESFLRECVAGIRRGGQHVA